MSESKLTEPRVEAVLDALNHGATREAAAAAGGITRVTLWRWLNDDETLRNEVEKAEGRAEYAFTTVVANAAVSSWQAAAWWLERRRYQAFARHDAVDVRIDIKAEVRKLADELGLDEDAALAEVEALLSAR